VTEPATGRTPITVAITGATGLIGSTLAASLTAEGHAVRRIRRGEGTHHPPASGGYPGTGGRGDIVWDPAAGRLDPRALEGVDAVVHLAGESVADRWTKARKKEILASRVNGTRLLAETLARLERPPSVLVSGSAVGYYGDRGDEILDESAGPGRGFLADVVRAWEDATAPARAVPGLRVVHSRTGLVMTPRGGVLHRLLPPFKLGLGGKVAHGRQWISWIALDDVVAALRFLIVTGSLRGPVNVTSPDPVTNAAFAQALGHALHRPAIATIPEFAVKLVLGAEQTEEMALASQRAVPRVLEGAGFRFRFPTIDVALRHELAAAG
jgi:hypothetical protein